MSWLDKLTNPLTERVRSPLYGTFMISWLLYNWKIVLTILMPSYVMEADYTIIEHLYEKHYINILDCLIMPLILSGVYIWFMPLLDFEIVKYSEEQRRKKIDAKIEIGKKHKVEGSVFYALKLRFQEEQKNSIQFEEENIKLKTEKSDLKKEADELEQEIKALQTKNTNLERMNQQTTEKYQLLYNRSSLKEVFTGRWKLNYSSTLPNSNHRGSEYFEIRNNDEYYVIGDDGSERFTFRIHLVDFDPEAKKISFLKADPNSGEPKAYNKLRIISNDRFEGDENSIIKVMYERQKFEKIKTTKD